MSAVTITEDHIRRELRKLHPAKASGPDGIYPQVLLSCGVLLRTFNLSLSIMKVPVLWKSSCLVQASCSLTVWWSLRGWLNHPQIQAVCISCQNRLEGATMCLEHPWWWCFSISPESSIPFSQPSWGVWINDYYLTDRTQYVRLQSCVFRVFTWTISWTDPSTCWPHKKKSQSKMYFLQRLESQQYHVTDVLWVCGGWCYFLSCGVLRCEHKSGWC